MAKKKCPVTFMDVIASFFFPATIDMEKETFQARVVLNDIRNHLGHLGTVFVYKEEYEAETMYSQHKPGSRIICYGGFYNAVWEPNEAETGV